MTPSIMKSQYKQLTRGCISPIPLCFNTQHTPHRQHLLNTEFRAQRGFRLNPLLRSKVEGDLEAVRLKRSH